MLTGKKRLYAEARISGESKKNSAIAAGYSEKTAQQAASRLEKDKDVIACMGRINGQSVIPPSETTGDKDASCDEGKSYDDPLEFLMDIVNNSNEDLKIRQDAAKACLPYKHPKVGEVGKKEKADEEAQSTANGRFKAGKAPNIYSIRDQKKIF